MAGTFATLYATAEDLIIKAPADVPDLYPRDQVWAKGSDGQLDATARVFLSASCPFHMFGVPAGSLIILSRERSPVGDRAGEREVLVVDAVSPSDGSAVLRRRGRLAGEGMPSAMGPAASGLGFVVPDLDPQLRSAADRLRRRFGLVDDRWLKDPGDFRLAVTLLTLYDLYAGQTKQSQGVASVTGQVVKKDLYQARSEVVAAELTAELAELQRGYPLLGTYGTYPFVVGALGPADPQLAVLEARRPIWAAPLPAPAPVALPAPDDNPPPRPLEPPAGRGL
jgi:hypothetical protein